MSLDILIITFLITFVSFKLGVFPAVRKCVYLLFVGPILLLLHCQRFNKFNSWLTAIMDRYRLRANLSPPPPPPPPRSPPSILEKTSTRPAERLVKLKKPSIVGYMSVDLLRAYHHDLSQLKYLTSIPQGRLRFDLNYNIDKAVKRTTDDSDEKITLMLKFLLDQKHRLRMLSNKDMVFLSYRQSLTSVMCNIYNCTPVTIVASLLNNCIYFCSLESPQEALWRKSCKEQDKFCAWDYKFEQYLLSDAPYILPDVEKPVLENEEFSVFYSTYLGNHKLFYGARIDGMMATKPPLKFIPRIDDVDANLKFLRNNCFVELETHKEMYHKSQLCNFRRYTLLRCWCQCYLAGLKGLLVGYRNGDGIIRSAEWFETASIASFCKDMWSPQIAISFLYNFLSFVKDSFKKMEKTYGDNPTKPLTLKFDINERQKFTVTKTDETEHIILPSWYVDIIQVKEQHFK